MVRGRRQEHQESEHAGQTGAAPTEQLKSLGLDPSAWGTSYTMVGTEDLAGRKVYHVKAHGRPAEARRRAHEGLEDPKLAKKLGDTSQLKQLEQGLARTRSRSSS